MNTNISLRFMRANVIYSLFTFGGGIVLGILADSIAIMRSKLKKKSGSVWRASSNSHIKVVALF
jgi:hypothetical protein